MRPILALLLLCVSAFGQQTSLTENVKGILPRKNGGLGVGAINSYGGSVASASSLTVACNQSLTVTGATTINTITMASPVGCAAILIAGAGATWSTSTSGNISAVVSPAVGSAAILVSDGTKFNPGLSNAAGAAILGPLQFLQGTPNVIAPANRAANLPYLLSGDFAFPAQAPGTTLTGGTPATATLVPGPLGISGALANTYVRLSAGTGTAEATLITGGSCDGSGQPSCTIAFTPANNHTGAWTITSATAGIKEALNYLPADGGQVWMPAGQISIYATIVLGDGTATLKSTRNSMALMGRGPGRGVDTAFPADGATTLLWAGASGGTMMRVAGPVGNGTVEGMMLDGQGVAAIGLDIVHSYSWTFRKLTIVGWSSIGLRSMALDYNFSGMVTGNNNNTIDTVTSAAGTGGGASVGCQFGQAVPNTLGGIYDFASNLIINSVCRSDAGIGTELRLADNNVWIMTAVGSLKFTKVVDGFPGANAFYSCPQGTVSSSAGFDLTTTYTNLFFPFSSTDTGQDPREVIRFASGVDLTGAWFGIQKYAPLYYTTVTSSSAIASTNVQTAFDRSYALPAYVLNSRGAQLQIAVAGRLSTTGTPALTLRVKLGALEIGRFPFTTYNNSNFQPFQMNLTATTTTTGAANFFLMGSAWGNIGGSNGRTSEVTGVQGFDPTIANTITVTAEWGASSPSNTITLDGLAISVVYPGAVQ